MRKPSAFNPLWVIFSTAEVKCFSGHDVIHTCAPASAKASLMGKPILPAPPTTTAHFPLRENNSLTCILFFQSFYKYINNFSHCPFPTFLFGNVINLLFDCCYRIGNGKSHTSFT